VSTVVGISLAFLDRCAVADPTSASDGRHFARPPADAAPRAGRRPQPPFAESFTCIDSPRIMPSMPESESGDRLRLLETEIERRLAERFAALREEFDRLRLESDRRWFGFLEKFDQDLKGVVPRELVGGAETPPTERREGISAGAARALDQASTQVDVLHRYLDECRRYCSRAALLVARGGAIGAWKAVGFSSHGGDDDAIRQISMPLTEGGILSRVMTGTAIRLPPSNDISSLMRIPRVAEAVAIPMVVREKISGALYADAAEGEETAFDPEALGFLTFLAGLVVDRLAGRKLKPAPALRSLETVKRPEPASMWMDEGPSLAEEVPTEEPAEPPPSPAPRAAEHVDEPAPSFRPTGSAPSMPPAASPPPPSRPPEVEVGRILGGPLAQAAGDERREEARRFARLLISEIKLYNERAVLEGRESGNLYSRLREDIDRSRQMYNERIPEDVRAATNFFHEELVRILADGRPEVLGV
jgi:hypothetical protein